MLAIELSMDYCMWLNQYINKQVAIFKRTGVVP